MQLNWLIFLLSALLLPTANSLRVFNATEWQLSGSFGGYNVYKPVCPGRYRIGDVVVSADAPLNATVVARALVCVQGDSDEIQEAPSYEFGRTAGTASLFREYKSVNSNVTLVLGSTSLPLSIWQRMVSKSQGSTTESDQLRGYGVLMRCRPVSCPSTTIPHSDVGELTHFKVWDALATFGLNDTAFLPLFRFANSTTSDYLTSRCLPPSCFCDTTCVNGKCNPKTGGCVCEAGWQGADCAEDIDECEEGIDMCDSVSECTNTAPGYYCVCPRGFTPNPNGFSCDDINECLESTVCAIGETCTNYAGGYDCNTCDAGEVLVNGVCEDVNVIFACGNGDWDQGEECDRGLGCALNCTCSPGFTFQNETDCARDCGNGVLNPGEQCDSGMGCLDTCLCDANQGYQPANSTACQAVYLETDPCARFSGNCSDCLAFNCLYCNATSTCATSRISSDCLDQCPGDVGEILVPANGVPTPSDNVVDSTAAMIQTVVPAVVISVSGAVAGVVVLVVLLKRRNKKAKAKTEATRED